MCDDSLQVTDLVFGVPMHVATPLFDPSTPSSMVSIPLMGTLPSELVSLSHLVSLQLTRPAMKLGWDDEDHPLLMGLETNGFWNELLKSRLVLGSGVQLVDCDAAGLETKSHHGSGNQEFLALCPSSRGICNPCKFYFLLTSRMM